MGTWIVTSGGPMPPVPDVTLPDFLLTGRDPARAAVVDGPSGRGLTYGELADGVRRVAAGFTARGLRAGDTVALLAPNQPEWLLAAYGVMTAGGVVTGVNPLATAAEVAAQVTDAGARFLVTVPPFLATAREAVAGRDVPIVLIGPPAPGTTAFAELLDGGAPPDVRLDPATDLALLPYSSGTSGLPKGVMLTHRACVANVVQQEGAIPFSGDDRVLAVAPFFHAVGLGVVANAALHAGATLVTMPRFDVEQFLGLVERYRITGTVVVPPIVLALAKHPAVARADLSSLRFVGCGAAPLGAGVQQAAATRIGCPVLQGWGMTEIVAGGAIWPFGTPVVPGAAGMLFPGTQARVVDLADGTDLPPGGAGELWVRTPSVMAGYRGARGATAATVDADGWLHTGDVAAVSAEEIMAYVAERVAPYKRVRAVEFIEVVPTSPAGKTLRRLLRT